MATEVVLFTSLNHGGIFQFANQMAITLKGMGVSFVLLVPKGTKKECADAVVSCVVEYNLPRWANCFDKNTKELVDWILSLNPRSIIAVDDAIKSSSIVKICSKKIRCAIVVHDVNPHPQTFSIYRLLSDKLRRILAKKAFDSAKNIILLSNNSYQLFCEQHGNLRTKAILFPLGAHVMPAVPVIPKELEEYNHLDCFALFFGRIDVYKGVDRLIRTQKINCSDYTYKFPLVIAGVNLTSENYKTMDNMQMICIPRFITDGEMIWLFEHCSVVVLPYYEASQSGVLPIAYKFGKPVIVSDINGLRELVYEGVTGNVFKNDDQLSHLLKVYSKQRSINPNKEICEFYEEHYDWGRNIRYLLERIKEDDE